MSLATNEIPNSTKDTQKIILAIPADAAAIPEKPSTPAISAITKRMITVFNIILFLIDSTLLTS